MDLKRFVLDVNPEKINPRHDDEPRNPRKFDQKVQREQLLCNFTRLTGERRKLVIEQELRTEHIDRDIQKTRDKARCLRKLTRTHNFLHKLRDIVNGLPESVRDWEVERPPRGSCEAAANCQRSAVQKAVIASVSEPARAGPPPAPLTSAAAYDDELLSEHELATISDKCRLLAKMKKDIAQSVLPPMKLKRILPERSDSIAETWPIMSNYRRFRMLPSVNRQKLEELTDRATLRKRIDVYFGSTVRLQFPPLARPPPSEERLLLNALRGARD